MAVQQDINEALVNDVLKIYSSAEDKMLKAVAKRVAKGIKEEGWTENMLKEVQVLNQEIEKILDDTQKLSDAKVSQGIIDAYKSGVQEVDGAKGTHNTVLDELDIPMNLKMQVLATNKLLSNASFQVLRKADDAYQTVMAQSTTGLLAGVDTRRQASQKMLNDFAMKGITTFVDKAGRNWDLGSYAEMCVRTVSHNVARQGHFDRQLEVGEDLVKVSKIGTTCPICQRWQGVVLSISGNHPKYHSVDEAKASGLFHPNCKHIFNMYIEELDGPGKVEPDDYNENTASSQLYYETQKQRANERNIRYWKKRRALAITPEELAKANQNIKKWQYKNLIHCEKHGLRRNYTREGVMEGHATGPKGPLVGGSLKEYEEVFKGVIGQAPKPLFMKMNLQFFAQDPDEAYEKWLKEEIQSLDDLDVDKAMMKDANNKNVTPTSLYKKYIGDNPGQDYAEVTEFDKGTKEYKSGYAKWLKQQIDEIGVTYKVKPKYVEVHEDIADEDKSLSATELYKKYHNGEKPTEAYKKLGGEAGTGMAYGKWVETQKKELIKNGITKTVPFGNTTTQKTVNVISQASKGIDDAKLKAYKADLNSKVHGNYDGYLAVKEALEDDDGSELSKAMIEAAKEKHLEMVKKKAEKLYGTQAFDDEHTKLFKLWVDEPVGPMMDHINDQLKVYVDVEKAHKEGEKKKAEAEAKKKAAEEAAKKQAQKGLPGKVSIGREVSFKEGKLVKHSDIYNEVDFTDLDKLATSAEGNKLMKASRRDVLGRDSAGRNHHMGHDVRLIDGADKELGAAMQTLYDEYINTIKCNDINMACVKGYDKATSSMKKKIDAIDRAIAAHELNEPIVLNRFLSDDVASKMFGKLDLSEVKKGKLFENPSFMSTTVSGHPTFEKRDIMMSIQCDKGTHALPTLNYEEGEVLLGRDGKLEVVEIIDHANDPKILKHYDGTTYEYRGKEVVTRYIEKGKAEEYEIPTVDKIDKMLGTENVSTHTSESKKWIKTLSSAERKASDRYTGSWYTRMNDVYRRGKRDDSNVVGYSESLTGALRRAQTSKPVVLRRGIYEEDLAHMLGFKGNFSDVKAHWDEINKGEYAAEDKGFLSTSPYTHGGFTSKDVELRIYCPAGTHAAYVDSISTHKGEQETLLQSGSMYRVIKLETRGYKTVAYLELLGTD